MDGYIMQMQDLSVNDGEGVRTIVFLAGCPLRCRWCANPEGQTTEAYVDADGTRRVNSYVRKISSREVIAHIHRQDLFYRMSGGGVTFSGGEATSQRAFLGELTDILYDEGYDLALETCGWFDFGKTAPILRKMNLIFMDIKHMDSLRHEHFTGRPNAQILENAVLTSRLAGETGAKLVIRVPVIIGVNGNDQDLRDIFRFVRDNLPGADLELLPYHRYGEEKYRKMGLPLPDAGFGIPADEQMEAWRNAAAKMGIRVVSYR